MIGVEIVWDMACGAWLGAWPFEIRHCDLDTAFRARCMSASDFIIAELHCTALYRTGNACRYGACFGGCWGTGEGGLCSVVAVLVHGVIPGVELQPWPLIIMVAYRCRYRFTHGLHHCTTESLDGCKHVCCTAIVPHATGNCQKRNVSELLA